MFGKDKKKIVPVKNAFDKKVVIHQMTVGSVKIQLFSAAQGVEGAPILTGFPNIGITPVLTVNYLVEDLDLPLIGSMKATSIPPTSIVSSVGQPCHSIRIFGDHRMVIIASELKIPDGMTQDLVDAIMEVAKYIKASMVYCVEGVPVEKVDSIEREEMQFLTNCHDMASRLLELGHSPLHDAVVSGITGGLLSDCSCVLPDELGINITCLLAPTSSFYPDAWASVMLIKLLNTLSGDSWNSDTSRLEKSAGELESKVKQLLSNNLRRSGGSWSQMYR